MLWQLLAAAISTAADRAISPAGRMEGTAWLEGGPMRAVVVGRDWVAPDRRLQERGSPHAGDSATAGGGERRIVLVFHASSSAAKIERTPCQLW